MAGHEIGDLLRTWQIHHGKLSDRRYAAAFRAARDAVVGIADPSKARTAAMSAIHAALT